MVYSQSALVASVKEPIHSIQYRSRTFVTMRDNVLKHAGSRIKWFRIYLQKVTKAYTQPKINFNLMTKRKVLAHGRKPWSAFVSEMLSQVCSLVINAWKGLIRSSETLKYEVLEINSHSTSNSWNRIRVWSSLIQLHSLRFLGHSESP